MTGNRSAAGTDSGSQQLILEEHRRSYEIVTQRYAAAEEYLTWVMRTSVLLFAGFSTAASVTTPTTRASLPLETAVLFVTAVGTTFLAFAYAVDSLSVTGVDAWIAEPGENPQSADATRALLVAEYRTRIQKLDATVQALETTGRRAVIMLYFGIVCFLGGSSLLALEAMV